MGRGSMRSMGDETKLVSSGHSGASVSLDVSLAGGKSFGDDPHHVSQARG